MDLWALRQALSLETAEDEHNVQNLACRRAHLSVHQGVPLKGTSHQVNLTTFCNSNRTGRERATFVALFCVN